jgi:tetratricopeptide (TPR) repeat protein
VPRIRTLIASALFGGACSLLAAAPFTPKSDSEVVERLPSTANDPSVRRVDSLRKQLVAKPGDNALRIEIARRYFDLAMAQGDPRYVGYASAALNPAEQASAKDASFWLATGLIQQYSHDFAGAMRSLSKSSELDPQSAEPIAWRAAIHMVQARYPEALGECTKLVPLTHPLFAQGCTAYVQASTGHLQEAYAALNKAVANAGNVAPELLLWAHNRLAEMAIRLQKPAQAEAHFKEAHKQGVTDQFLLGAWSDFLISQNRQAEATKLLADWERSDVLLLRLALAGKAANDPRTKGWAAQLRDRFEAAALRGDRLHEQEAARFELDVEGHPDKALAYAARNYTEQKEPRDAEILMRSALAANQPKAAQPALDWLRNSRYEDTALAKIADQLAAKGATR